MKTLLIEMPEDLYRWLEHGDWDHELAGPTPETRALAILQCYRDQLTSYRNYWHDAGDSSSSSEDLPF